jgi:hypothetical protein
VASFVLGQEKKLQVASRQLLSDCQKPGKKGQRFRKRKLLRKKPLRKHPEKRAGKNEKATTSSTRQFVE